MKFVFVTKEGIRRLVDIKIDAPVQEDCGDWTCQVTFDGLFPAPRKIWGVDMFCALILGLRFVAGILQGRINRGERILTADNEEDYPLDEFFGDLMPRPKV